MTPIIAKKVFHIFHELHHEICEINKCADRVHLSQEKLTQMLLFINNWRALVESIAEGYPLGLHDYRHDLEVRHWSTEDENHIPDPCKELFWRVMKIIDREFFLHTFQIEKHAYTFPSEPPLPESPESPEFWYRRLPNKLLLELEEDTVGLRSCPWKWIRPVFWEPCHPQPRILHIGEGANPELSTLDKKMEYLLIGKYPEHRSNQIYKSEREYLVEHSLDSISRIEKFVVENDNIKGDVMNICDHLIEWFNFSNTILPGYPYNLEKYVADVDLRYKVRHLGKFSPGDFQDYFDLAVRSIDELFKWETFEVKTPLAFAETSVETEDEFWLRRLPYNLIPPLADETKPWRLKIKLNGY